MVATNIFTVSNLRLEESLSGTTYARQSRTSPTDLRTTRQWPCHSWETPPSLYKRQFEQRSYVFGQGIVPPFQCQHSG